MVCSDCPLLVKDLWDLRPHRAVCCSPSKTLPVDLTADDVKALFSLPDDDDSMHQQSKT